MGFQPKKQFLTGCHINVGVAGEETEDAALSLMVTSTQIKTATSVLITGLLRASFHVGRGKSFRNTRRRRGCRCHWLLALRSKLPFGQGSLFSSSRRLTAFYHTGESPQLALCSLSQRHSRPNSPLSE